MIGGQGSGPWSPHISTPDRDLYPAKYNPDPQIAGPPHPRRLRRTLHGPRRRVSAASSDLHGPEIPILVGAPFFAVLPLGARPKSRPPLRLRTQDPFFGLPSGKRTRLAQDRANRFPVFPVENNFPRQPGSNWAVFSEPV